LRYIGFKEILMKVKFIEKAQNQAGTTYGLALLPNGKFGVYILKHNYAGHVRGGIVASWRYCLIDVEEAAARELFQKKLKGKVKA
jgi:hypothetical protein